MAACLSFFFDFRDKNVSSFLPIFHAPPETLLRGSFATPLFSYRSFCLLLPEGKRKRDRDRREKRSRKEENHNEKLTDLLAACATLLPEDSLPTRSSETQRGVLALKAAANSAGVVTQSYWLRSCEPKICGEEESRRWKRGGGEREGERKEGERERRERVRVTEFFPFLLSVYFSPLFEFKKSLHTSFWIAIVVSGCSLISRARAQAASK